MEVYGHCGRELVIGLSLLVNAFCGWPALRPLSEASLHGRCPNRHSTALYVWYIAQAVPFYHLQYLLDFNRRAQLPSNQVVILGVKLGARLGVSTAHKNSTLDSTTPPAL